ncbi:25193_t:CDS:1, partial [Dentiscutata erythropus]
MISLQHWESFDYQNNTRFLRRCKECKYIAITITKECIIKKNFKNIRRAL